MSVCDVVARSRWADVLGQFCASHRGWLASMFIVRPGPELMSHTDWRRLESVMLTRDGGRQTVRITFQGWPEVSVDGPRALAVDRTRDGIKRALEIDAAGGVSYESGFERQRCWTSRWNGARGLSNRAGSAALVSDGVKS